VGCGGVLDGDLPQVTTDEQVLTCHEAASAVQRRLRTGMAAPGEVVRRQRFCLLPECRARFWAEADETRVKAVSTLSAMSNQVVIVAPLLP
jgi:hypothetical protein